MQYNEPKRKLKAVGLGAADQVADAHHLKERWFACGIGYGGESDVLCNAGDNAGHQLHGGWVGDVDTSQAHGGFIMEVNDGSDGGRHGALGQVRCSRGNFPTYGEVLHFRHAVVFCV